MVTMDVSLNSEMKKPTYEGSTARNIWGRITHVMHWNRESPVLFAASHWPFCTLEIPALNISA